MKLLADMGVSVRVVNWLRSGMHDVVHLRERGLQRLPDLEIFKLAANEKRTILTFDLDFGEIVAESRDEIVSVILFRLHNTATTNVIARLTTVLPACATDLIDGAIVVVEEGRHRVRKLPIGS
jgi:predicted nuclease of predicted toxin-antitoxin system